jgi:hypothetical protein
MKICFILENIKCNGLLYNFIESVSKDKRFYVNTVIIQLKPAVKKKFFHDKLLKILNIKYFYNYLSKKFREFIINLEINKFKKSLNFNKDYCEIKNAEIFFDNKIEVFLETKNNVIYRYPQKKIEYIKELKFDLILNFSGIFIRGEILSSCRFGIISFHNSDNRINRGGPGGFWEIYFSYPKTGFIIQKLENELDAGFVLSRGEIDTEDYWIKNDAKIKSENFKYLEKLLNKIYLEKKISFIEEKLPYFNILNKNPNLFQLINYIIKIKFNFSFNLKKINKLIFNIFNSKQKNCLAVYNSNFRNLVMWKAKKIHFDKKKMFKNFFLFEYDKKPYIFFDSETENSLFVCCIDHIKENIYKNFSFLSKKILPKIIMFGSKPFLFCKNKMNKIDIYSSNEFPNYWTFENSIDFKKKFINFFLIKLNNEIYVFLNVEKNINDRIIFTEIICLKNFDGKNFSDFHFLHTVKGKTNSIFIANNEIIRSYKIMADSTDLKVSKLLNLGQNNFTENNLINIQPNFSSNAYNVSNIQSTNNYTIFEYNEF